METFVEISVIIVITAIIAGILRWFKQPLIIGYIIAGIVIGPALLNLVRSNETIEIFSHIGIALLLFTVGLNINPKILKKVGKVSLITGVGQVVFTSVIGFFIGTLLGFPTTVSIYIAIALTFSSTIIIMKLLSDKNETDTLFGRIAIGFLLVQDLIVILVLMVVSSLAGEWNIASLAFGVIVKGIGLIGITLLVGFFILPRITKSIAKSQEFLMLFSIGWCLALASLSYCLNLSIEIGALLAGVTLAMSPYRLEISSKMRPLRDIFIILFFILLGSQMIFSDITQYIIPILIFSAFILIGNPIIVMVLMGLLGYTKRNSFLAGLTVAQISEFSLILIALGVKVGHLTNDILSFVTVVGLITITGSTYLILYADRIYPYLSKYLSVFERRGRKVDEHKYLKDETYNTILFGYHRTGFDILKAFKEQNRKFLVVDYNPEIIMQLAGRKINCRYGDVGDVELLNKLNLVKIKMAISTIPNVDTNLLLIDKIRESNKTAVIIVVSHQIDEATKLYDAGATYVLMPHFLGGHHVAKMLKEHGLNFDEFFKERSIHLEHLRMRRELGHEHPKHEIL
jgi:Kef-type K+ transport system membrane component KefB/voltage-gated potassium channel Kch